MKPRWQPVIKTKASVLFQWYVFEGHKKPYYQRSLNLDFGLNNQKIIADEISIDLNEFAALETLLKSKISKDPNFLTFFINHCHHYADSLLDISKTIGVGDQSANNLLKLYGVYQSHVLNLIPFLNTILVIDGLVKQSITQILEQQLNLTDPDKQNTLLNALIIPSKDNYFVQAQKQLLNLALKVTQNPHINIDADIEKYLKQFGWLETIAYYGDFLSRKKVSQQITNLVNADPTNKAAQIRQTKTQAQRDYKRAYSQIESLPDLVTLVDQAQELAYLQTYRLDVFFYSHFLASPLFQALGDQLHLSPQQTVYLTGPEIIASLKGASLPNVHELNMRLDCYSLILEQGTFTLLSGDQVNINRTGNIAQSQIKGTVACRGRAVGTAKLIHSVEDMGKMNQGDMLISVNTIPQFVPAMVKASGIITDVGGMLSHAAIISREYGIPCIVGTHNATKNFKDGDLIELNAYDGIARIIKQ